MRYRILINPSEYDDTEDHGFCTSVEAKDEAEAKALAIAECEAGNDWEPGHIDADACEVWDCDPDYQHQVQQLKPVLDDLLAYEREAFEQDTPLDLADLCTAFGRWRAQIKAALGLDLVGCETAYAEPQAEAAA